MNSKRPVNLVNRVRMGIAETERPRYNTPRNRNLQNFIIENTVSGSLDIFGAVDTRTHTGTVFEEYV